MYVAAWVQSLQPPLPPVAPAAPPAPGDATPPPAPPTHPTTTPSGREAEFCSAAVPPPPINGSDRAKDTCVIESRQLSVSHPPLASSPVARTFCCSCSASCRTRSATSRSISMSSSRYSSSRPSLVRFRLISSWLSFLRRQSKQRTDECF